MFVNDKWDLNTHWNFNLGARYDKNNAVNSLHQTTSRDSAVSPRLGLNYDILGNGKYRITAGYNTYVGRLAEAVTGASSPAGSPAEFDYIYEGPQVNNLNARDFSANFFNWFNANGGLSNTSLIVFTSVPGAQVQLRGSLKSPSVKEYTIGGGMQIGSGFIRADYIDRNWRDFYVNSTVLANGTVLVNGAPTDLTLIQNTNALKRTYRGVDLQGQYRLFSNLQLGANYTFSRLRGNAVQENAGSGPVSEAGTQFTYPEYENFVQNNPQGYLPSDQTHKLRAWASYDLHTFFGNWNFSGIQRLESGIPYSLTGTIDVRFRTNFYCADSTNPACSGGVKNPGYATPPSSVVYFFDGRGTHRLQSLRATDFSSTYSFPFHGFEPYVEGYVFNAFNNHAIVNLFNGASQDVAGTSVTTARQSSTLKRFNPFVDTPVAGVNYVLPTGITATNKAAYQNPRSFSMAVGVRF
jgi:hypothetical protein